MSKGFFFAQKTESKPKVIYEFHNKKQKKLNNFTFNSYKKNTFNLINQ